MASLFQAAIVQANSGIDLGEDQASDLIDAMLRGEAEERDVASLLLALKEKGESVSELVGASRAMRRHMTQIPHSHPVLLDTCGTGGSGSGTFNISTAVAIVAAAAGVAVAKHGNRRATSLTGSADVLEVLGVPIESEPDLVAKRLDRDGICFCFAAKLHPAMRHVIGVRRQLGVKTLFNLLGPLCNPAGATHQLLGTSTPETQSMVSAAIGALGTTRSFVVHGIDGQDEVSLDGATRVVDVRASSIEHYDWTPADFGLLPAGREALAAANPNESAEIICRIFDGEPVLVGAASDIIEGVKKAAETIDSGAAKAKLASLVGK